MGGMVSPAGIVSLLFGVIELLLGARIVLRLLDANPANQVVALVNAWSQPFRAPFVGMFPVPEAYIGGVHAVFEVNTFIALLAYAIVGGILVAFLPGGGGGDGRD